ncbi:hypothetical protein AAC387_Pa02g2745 [Persea americana]
MGIEKNTPVSTPAPIMVNNGEKPEKFNESPALIEGETDKQVVAAVETWKHVDFLCRNYILNGLENTLYNVYCALKTAKEL